MANKIFIENKILASKINFEFEVRFVENRGRDNTLFLIECLDLWLRFDVILHLHSKRSSHVSWGDNWRTYLFDSLIGSEAVFSQAIHKFNNNDALGILYPENYWRLKKSTYETHNSTQLDEFMKEFEGGVSKLKTNQFAAGFMGWYRICAFKSLLSKINNIDLFDEEKGQIDSTLAHVLERSFAKVAETEGHESRPFTLKIR